MHLHRFSRGHRLAPLIVLGALITVVACGGGSPPQATDPTTGPTSTTAPTTTTPMTTTVAPPTTEPVPMAVWTSTDPDIDSPQSAAEAMIGEFFGVAPLIGEFMAGDAMSGEIEVYSAGEGPQVVRSLLLMRQLGSQARWSVLAAINTNIQIDAPRDGGVFVPGMLTVSGLARGYEGTIIVSAYRVGDYQLIDQQIGAGGALADPEPFSVVLDLSNTQIGDVIAIIVRGDTGLSDDTGEFSAIPIQIG
jgi:cell division inhibitor SulA